MWDMKTFGPMDLFGLFYGRYGVRSIEVGEGRDTRNGEFRCREPMVARRRCRDRAGRSRSDSGTDEFLAKSVPGWRCRLKEYR